MISFKREIITLPGKGRLIKTRVITRMEQDALRAGADPSASKLAIQAASMTKEEVDARLAAKMAAIELAR